MLGRRFPFRCFAQERGSRRAPVQWVMGTLLQDIRYGWRMLSKTPALTAVVAITLALGIGANALIFSLVNGFLLRPMPVSHAEQIAVLASTQKGASPFAAAFSYPDFVDFPQTGGLVRGAVWLSH